MRAAIQPPSSAARSSTSRRSASARAMPSAASSADRSAARRTRRPAIQEMVEELDRRARDLEEERARVAALESQVFYLQEAINQNYNIEELVGVSPTFKQAMRD